ncbi:hypothetical protein RF11_08313 [Thelohanellus kitauei]|uniref:Uncharacterized protein n=1 Tax=Thelohanellus kitauei TaxID=669202 RepID=A0A0C2M8T4_THEKT|nr:hypothetical protein RF11_08313 [Thelohanellus kitauei]
MDFLLENKAIIDLKRKEIKIGQKSLSLIDYGKPEQVLIEKTNLAKLSESEQSTECDIPNDIQVLITDLENANPTIGVMPSGEHDIVLIDPLNKPLRRKDMHKHIP